MLNYACEADNASVYMALVQSGYIPGSGCLEVVMRSKHREIVDDLVRHTHWNNQELCGLLLMTCVNGNYRAYTFLTRERGFRPDGIFLSLAVREGMPEIVADLARYNH